MICGKIAAGKSTLARRLGQTPNSVVLSEDDWLSELYPEEIKTGRDYVLYAERLKTVLGPHVVEVLRAGVSVILDFPANTVAFRGWMRGIIDRTGADHRLHVLAPPDEVCLARLRDRNASGAHPFSVTEAQFHQIARHFAPPAPEEGFNLVIHDEAT